MSPTSYAHGAVLPKERLFLMTKVPQQQAKTPRMSTSWDGEDREPGK